MFIENNDHRNCFLTNPSPIGVVLLNLGGPDSLKAVRPFLYNLFSDREIIRLGPPFMQKPLAWLISMMRAGKAKKLYGLIGGGSPILPITEAQSKALEKSLERHGSFKVYIGMRYWHPYIEDAVNKIRADGIKKIICLSLYPHYSRATTGSSVRAFEAAVKGLRIEYSCINEWYDNPFYIDALVELIKNGLGLFPGGDAEVVFSAHSLPVSFVEEGDPYVEHIMRSIGETAKRVHMRWHLCYQSKSGPVKWLEPSTEEMLGALAGKGIKNILMVPISFVSDHIETLYEIDILYKRIACSLGIKMERTGSLNTRPMFIKALEDIVLKEVKRLGWQG
jgi:ferrochelatase